MTLRERLRTTLTRGKVECSLRIELNTNQNNGLALNQEYAKQVISSLQWLKETAQEGEINLVDILRFPGVVDNQNQDLDQISQDLLEGFEQILAEFIAMRGREGANLQALIQQAEAKLEEKEQAKKQVKDEQAANKARIDSAKITTPAPAATFKIKRN